MSYLVFISHAGADIWAAWQLGENIKKCGASYFLDQLDIVGGADFEKELLAKLKEAKELWVLLSPNSLPRSYVWMEVGVAWFRGIAIVPIAFGMSPKDIADRDNVPQLVKKADIIEAGSNIDRYKRFLSEFRERLSQSEESRAALGGRYAGNHRPAVNARPAKTRGSSPDKGRKSRTSSEPAKTTRGDHSKRHPTKGHKSGAAPLTQERNRRKRQAAENAKKDASRRLGKKKPR